MDRGSKATLPLTIPRRVFKSSAKDSARRPRGITFQGYLRGSSATQEITNDTGPWEHEAPTAGRHTDGRDKRRFLAWILT